MGAIQLRDVNKSFGTVTIIPKINLDIEDGEFVVFVGPPAAASRPCSA